MAQHGLENSITCIKVTLNAPLCVFHMLYGLSEIKVYEGCSFILVIDSFSPKQSSIPAVNYLVVIDRFFAILKSPKILR